MHESRRIAAVVVVGALLAGLLQFVLVSDAAQATPGTAVRASTDGAGAQATAPSDTPAISGDGYYVAFVSSAALVPEDTNNAPDVYRKRMQDGSVDLVSASVLPPGPVGGPPAGNGASGGEEIAISEDGGKVVFRSDATDLIAGDTNGQRDLFVRDVWAGTTTRVNVDNGGGIGFGPDFFSMASDGNDIAFIAYSGLANGQGVYVRHVSQSTTSFVNFIEAGAQISISGDGKTVAYERLASAPTNVCPGGGFYELYVQELSPTVTSWANRGTSKNSCDYAGILGPNSLSYDGKILAYWSDGDAYHDTAMTPTAKPRAVYAFDLNAFKLGDVANETVRMSETQSGVDGNSGSGGTTNDWPKGAVTGDGTKVAFTSSASNLDPNAPAGGAMVKDRVTGAISGAFSTDAADVVANDTNGASDVFANVAVTPSNVRLEVNWNGLSQTITPPGASAVPTHNIPASAVPLGAAGDVAGAPLRSVSLADSPLRSVPLRSVPLRSVPLRSVPLRSVVLSDIPLRSVSLTWESILATLNPNPFLGVPLQTITLDQVLTAFDAQPAATGMSSITLDSIDLSSTPLRSVSLASIALGATPLRSVPLRSVDAAPNTPPDQVFQGWCELLVTLGYTCAGLGVTQDSPILALDLAGVPLRSVPLRSVPLRSVTIPETAPLRSVPLRSVNFAGTTLGALSTNVVIPAKRATVLTCDIATCPTFADAAAQNALVDTTLGTLLNALDMSLLPDTLTLLDLLQSLLNVQDYPWEKLPLDQVGIADYQPSGPMLDYSLRFTSSGVGNNVPATAVVTLPAGFRYVAGSSNYGEGSAPEPVSVVGNVVTWHLPVYSSSSNFLGFAVRPGLDLGPGQVSSASVTISGHTANASNQGPVTIVEQGEPGNSVPGTAPTIAGNTLYISHIATPGDVDYYKLPVPSKGTRIQLFLGVPNGADFDVALLNSNAPSTPLRSVPLRSVPLRSVPLADQGLSTNAATSPLSPETLQDIPTVAGAPLRSVSENRSSAGEIINTTADTAPSGATYTVQVSGFNGSTSNKPYVLYVKQYAPPPAPTCTARTFNLPGVAGAAPAISATAKTLFLFPQKRMGDTYGPAEATNVKNKLTTLAARADVQGIVYPIEAKAGVPAALTAWDADPCNPDLAHNAFTAVGSIVDSVRQIATGLKNIVVVGSDDLIPMDRVPDYTQISNEADYAASTMSGAGNPVGAALATQNILSDDPLADTDPIAWLDHRLYVPDLAVGRLIESPASIISQIDQFIASNGILDPKTSLTSGYDFLADGSQAVDAALAARIPASARKRLINETWSRADLNGQLYPAGAASPDVASLNAHYDHRRSLPALGNSTADESDLFTVDDVKAHPQALINRILMTMGCHAGLNLPDQYLPSGDPLSSDFAQTYVAPDQKAAVYFANTGFGYGDTASVALSEQLMTFFAQRLNGSMTIGEAASFAKQAYFGQLGAYGPYDEKAMQEATLYGLPMYKVGTTTVVPPATTTVAPGTADTNGVRSSPVTLDTASFTPNPSPGGGTFFTRGATTEAQTTQYRPIVPRTSVGVTPTTPGLKAHGFLTTELTSHDVATVPAVARPVIDQSMNEPPPLAGDVAFPTTFSNLTTFNTPNGAEQRLVLLPGQVFRDASWTGAGAITRLFDHMGGEVKYSPTPADPSTEDFTPPSLTNVTAVLTGTTLNFGVDTADANGIARVLVLVKDESGGVWKPLTLTDAGHPGHFTGTLTGIVGTQIEYFAQSQDKKGNVGITTNKGRYYGALQPNGSGPATPVTAPTLTPNPGQPNGDGGWYKSANVPVTISGQPGVTYTGTVDNGPTRSFPVTVTGDGTHLVKAKGTDGSSALLVVPIDTTKPTGVKVGGVTAGTTYSSRPPLTCEASDATSGIGSCTIKITGGNATSTNGNLTATPTAIDRAGNSTTGPGVSYKVNDTTKPIVSITAPGSFATYILKQPVNAKYSCADGERDSGLESCVGPVPNGAPIDTATVGLKPFTVTAKDYAGNTTTTTSWYRVAYTFLGWHMPIKAPMTYNKAVAGTVVPMTFGLEDYNHTRITDLSAVSYILTAKVPCSANDPMNDRDNNTDEYQAMGNLTSANGDFTYAWTTKATWRGQCRVLAFITKDVSIRPLLFDFR